MLDGWPLERDRNAVLQLDLPYVSPADVLAALKHAVRASPSGGTTLRCSIRLARPWLRVLASAVLLAWLAFAAWSLPHGIGFIPLAVFVVFVLYSWPAYVRDSRQDLEARLRELRPFLLSRIAP